MCERVDSSGAEQTHQEVKREHGASLLLQNHFLLHLHANLAPCCLCSHNGAQQIIVSSQRWISSPGLVDVRGSRAVFTRRHLGGDSSSITDEGKQLGPFSICANVREKDRSQELTTAEVGKLKSSSRKDGGRILKLVVMSLERHRCHDEAPPRGLIRLPTFTSLSVSAARANRMLLLLCPAPPAVIAPCAHQTPSLHPRLLSSVHPANSTLGLCFICASTG